MNEGLYRLLGALGSPYSLKMRAVLRYRRLPFTWSSAREGLEAAQAMKAAVIPVLQYPDGTRRNDSTELIRDLEERHPGARTLTPEDPADAFLALLIEDFADEWLSKPMYHYRWTRELDQRVMSRWLAWDYALGGGADTIAAIADGFRTRQVSRLRVVGSDETTSSAIEASAIRVLDILDRHVVERPFLFGDRPSVAEFALFGQISQFQFDPTPNALARERFPYAYRWIAFIDDLSGWERTAWRVSGSAPCPAITELLDEIGRLHLPFLVANAAAVAAGEPEAEFRLPDGAVLRQPAARYQAKCLAILQARFAALPPEAVARLAPMLESAGVLAPLTCP